LSATPHRGSIYLAGRVAQHRGRSFKHWGWIAGILIGPLAIPLLFLFAEPARQERQPWLGPKARRDARQGR
jgi:hypothetical protein